MDKAVSAEVVVVRWPTAMLGCMLPIVTFVVVLLGFAAVRPELAAQLAQQRDGALFGVFRGMEWQGVNIPLAGITLYMAWELWRFCWRWADVIAIRATPDGLAPHRSTGMHPLPWSEIADVSYHVARRGWRRVPTLTILLRDGSVKRIRGIANDAGEAEAFARHCAERLERGGSAGIGAGAGP